MMETPVTRSFKRAGGSRDVSGSQMQQPGPSTEDQNAANPEGEWTPILPKCSQTFLRFGIVILRFCTNFELIFVLNWESYKLPY